MIDGIISLVFNVGVGIGEGIAGEAAADERRLVRPALRLIVLLPTA